MNASMIVKCVWCGREIDREYEVIARNTHGEWVCAGDCLAAEHPLQTDGATLLGMPVETANFVAPGQMYVRPTRRR